MTSWLTFLGKLDSVEVTSITSGSFIKVLTRYLTFAGMVAEKRRVWRLGLVMVNMFSIWSKKLACNISSASSRTNFTFFFWLFQRAGQNFFFFKKKNSTKDFNILEREVAALNEIVDTAGGSDNDVNTTSQGTTLKLCVCATVHCGRPETASSLELFDLSCNLPLKNDASFSAEIEAKGFPSTCEASSRVGLSMIARGPLPG